MPGRALGWRLAGFAAALLVPTLLFVGVLLWRVADAERLRYGEAARSAARSLTVAVDREFAGVQAVLETLATSPHLAEGDLAAFHRQAGAIARRQGFELVLRDLTGRETVNTRTPIGEALAVEARLGDIDRRVIETGRPAVGDLAVGSAGREPLFSITAPVTQDDRIARLLDADLRPALLVQALRREGLPEGWIGAVVDGRGLIVALSTGDEGLIGKPASNAFAQGAQEGRGTWSGVSLGGVQTFGAFERSALTGWHGAVGVETRIVAGPQRRLLLALLWIGLALALAASLLAWVFGRSIAGSISALTRSAGALGRGETVRPIRTGLREADEVGQALSAASIGLRERARERDAAESALREGQERLRLALDGARLGDWSWNAGTDLMTVSPRAAEIFGAPPSPPPTWTAIQARVHAEDRDRVREAMRRTAETGEPYDCEYRLSLEDGREVWVSALGEARRVRQSGAIEGIVGIVQDVSERKRLEGRQRLFMQEMNHRVKNTLANVLSIASLTARSAGSVESYRKGLVDRVHGLAKTHDLLNENAWEGAGLREVLAGELEPYDDETGRVELTGPDLQLSPRASVSMGMIAHELTTNAVRYGSLSTPDGRVRVAWSVGLIADAARLDFTWTESGGPPVAEPVREGFGTRMIQRGLSRELAADIAFEYLPEGFRFTLSMPIKAAAGDPMASRRQEYARIMNEPEGLRIY